MTVEGPHAFYACINAGQAAVLREIAGRALCLNRDVGQVVKELLLFPWKSPD